MTSTLNWKDFFQLQSEIIQSSELEFYTVLGDPATTPNGFYVNLIEPKTHKSRSFHLFQAEITAGPYGVAGWQAEEEVGNGGEWSLCIW